MRNQDIEVKRRKYGHDLVSCGQAVLSFGVWSVLKSALYIAMLKDLSELTGEKYADDQLVITLVFAFLGFLILIDLGLRVVICKSAVKEGKELKNKGYLFLFLTGLLIIGDVISLILLSAGEYTDMSSLELLVALAVNITSIACMVMLIDASIKLKRLNSLVDRGMEVDSDAR